MAIVSKRVRIFGHDLVTFPILWFTKRWNKNIFWKFLIFQRVYPSQIVDGPLEPPLGNLDAQKSTVGLGLKLSNHRRHGIQSRYASWGEMAS